MDPLHFAYWLQGRAELKPNEPLTPEEWEMVKQHLALVFAKVTPKLGELTFPQIPGTSIPGFPGTHWSCSIGEEPKTFLC